MPTKNNQAGKSLKIFPNPTTGLIYLKTSSRISNIRVNNILGREVYHKALASPRHVYTLDLSRQPAGIYWLRVQDEKGNTEVRTMILKQA